MRRARTLLALVGLTSGLLVSTSGAASASPIEPSPKPDTSLPKGLVPVHVPVGTPKPRPLAGAQQVSGPFLIRSVWNLDMCLDRDANVLGNGARVQLWRCNGHPQQLWYFHHLDQQNYLIENGLGRILDAHAPCIHNNGCPVQVWQHVPGNINQVWWYQPKG